MKASDHLFDYLLSKSVNQIFLVAGGAAAHLLNSVKEKKISYTCFYHEQACAMAAEGYAKMTGKPACVLVTNGPGSSNAITGVLGAFQDSVPMIVISGQVKTRQSLNSTALGCRPRQLGVQECDIISMVNPITKYAVQVTDVNDFNFHLEQAFYLATTGRMGPVWLDIPIDIQSSDISELKPEIKLPSPTSNDCHIGDVIRLLQASKRPVIVAGNGIHLSKTEDLFLQLKERLGIPVVATWTAKDLMAYDDRLLVGNFGILGERAANLAVQNADLLLILGSRMSIPNVGYQADLFSPCSIKIMVDIDASETDKHTVKIDLKIHESLNGFLPMALRDIDVFGLPSWGNWVSLTQSWKRNYPVFSDENMRSDHGVNAFQFMEALSRNLRDNDVVVTDMGTSYTCTMQSLRMNGKNRLFTSSGCCSMGFGLPGAIGAWHADKSKRIILIAGDGGFQMNIQELQTVDQNNIPIKIFILNSNGYLAISLMQDNLFQGNRIGADPQSGVAAPDFVKIASAYGINSIRIERTDDLLPGIADVLDSEKSCLCEIIMNPKQQLLPRVQSRKNSNGSLMSDSLDNMFPYLSDDEMAMTRRDVEAI